MVCAHDGDVSIIDNSQVESYTMQNPPIEWTAEDAANQPAAEQAAPEAVDTSTVALADGTYEASGKGMGGDVPVTVTVEGGAITAVEVGDNAETQGIGTNAIEQLPELIVEANGTSGVSAVAGATVTSTAIFDAVNDCLSQASA